MASTYKADEIKYEEAVRIYNDKKARNETVSMRRLARDSGLNYSRLRGRIIGRQSRCARKRVNLRLDDAQYNELFQYLDTLDREATPLTPQLIKKAAEAILRGMQSDSSKASPKLSKMWAYRFIDQHPQYSNERHQAKGYQEGDAQSGSTGDASISRDGSTIPTRMPT